jgi:hypothetical protein
MTERFGITLMFLSCFGVERQLSASPEFNQIYHQYTVNFIQESPTTSCLMLGKSVSNTQCFVRCTMVSDIRFLFSRDSGPGSCACCNLPLSGSSLNGSRWQSFLRGESFFICVRPFIIYKLFYRSVDLIFEVLGGK